MLDQTLREPPHDIDLEQAILGGGRGEAARRALRYQIEVGEFWGAKRFVPVTNVHLMGDIEVMGDSGKAFVERMAATGAGATAIFWRC